MGFYTSLLYYRPGPPPRVTASDLGGFFVELEECGLLEGEEELTLALKFGESVDDDDKPISWDEPTDVPLIYGRGEIGWDVELRSQSLAALADQLHAESGTIFRASGTLGMLTDSASQHITRPPCDQNEHGFAAWDCSLTIGPIENCTLSMDKPVHVGWLAIGISGDGYLFPWEPKDIVARAEQSEPLKQLAAICRRHWPSSAPSPNSQTVELRKSMEQGWPYADVRKPLDWCWGVYES